MAVEGTVNYFDMQGFAGIYYIQAAPILYTWLFPAPYRFMSGYNYTEPDLQVVEAEMH